MCREGATFKIKIRIIYMDKLVQYKFDTCRPSSVVLFEKLTNEMQMVWELVSRLPTRPGEFSVGPTSYVPYRDYDNLLED